MSCKIKNELHCSQESGVECVCGGNNSHVLKVGIECDRRKQPVERTNGPLKDVS